jgi:outer membrane lipoprotein SlyB
MKEQIAKIKTNPVGTGVGAVGGYLIATKVLKTEKLWMTIAVAVVGGVVGAMVQANMKAKKGMPTASTVTAPVK